MTPGLVDLNHPRSLHMARTYRRRQQYLVRKYVGNRSKLLANPIYHPDDRDRMCAYDRDFRFCNQLECSTNVTPESAYKKRLARFHRDISNFSHKGPPRWFRHQRFNDRARRAERDEIRRCMRLDCWDDHHTGTHPRGAAWLWWWIQ